MKPVTIILHSRADDDVVPFSDSEELVTTSGLPASALIEVGSDHRLAGLLRWAKIFGSVRADETLKHPQNHRSSAQPSMTPDPEYFDPRKLRPGPIRHESLTPELLEQVRAVYDVIGQYLDTTLEQFEIGFMRDAHPDSEVAVWCSITAAWLAYHEKYLDDEVLPDEEEKKVVAALIAISTGVEDVAKLGVHADVGRKLLACYDSLGKE